MAWLVRDGDVLASLEVGDSFVSRLKGLLGREGLDGAYLIKPAMSVHTLGMKFAIDVAYCDASLKVLDTVTMRPHRVGLIRPRARCVVEAEAGAFERWRVRPGDQLEIRS